MNCRNRRISLHFLLFSIAFILFSFSAAHAVNLSGTVSLNPVSGGGNAYIGVLNIEDPDPLNMIAAVSVPVSGSGPIPYSIDLGASAPPEVLVIGFYDKNNSSDMANSESEDDWPDYGDVMGGFSTPVIIGATDVTGIYFPISTSYSAALPATLSLYDDFTALDGRLEKDKWFFAGRQLELVRQKKSGKLMSSLRSSVYDEKNAAYLNYSGEVNRLKADVRVDDIYSGVKFNTGSYAVAYIGASFFNAESDNPASFFGNIFTNFSIVKTNSNLMFYYKILKCMDTAGGNLVPIHQGEIEIPGGAQLHTWYQLEISYYAALNSFIFTIADPFGNPLKTVLYNNLPEKKGPVFSNHWAQLATKINNGNTQTDLCHVFAEFDNVYVNGILHDDFESPGGLDPAKWTSTEAVKAIENEKAVIMAESKGATETNTLRIVRPIPNTSVDVKINPESRVFNGSKGVARLEGNFYNDSFGKGPGLVYDGQLGEVWAQVYLDLLDNGTLSAKYYLQKTIVAQPSVSTDYQTIFSGTFDTFTADNAIQKGRTYRLGINFTGTQMIFSCTDLDSPEPHLTQSMTYDITGPAYASSYPYRALTSRVTGSSLADAGGNMIAEFESVWVGNRVDTDGDGLSDFDEFRMLLDPNHGDMDGDGIMDGNEEKNTNGRVDGNETDPREKDTDGDGIEDGVEIGLTLAQLPAFASPDFAPDADPATTTDPRSEDSDEDGFSDGMEDSNHNGRVDAGESDPNKGTTVSGRVMDNAGNPVPGLWVHSFDAPCGGNWLGGGRTDENGHYTMYNMPAGNVYVQACANCDNMMLTNEWWTGTDTAGSFNCNDARNLTIQVDGDATGIDFNLDPAGNISGYVRDSSGNGLSGLHVYVRSDACNGIQYSQANTDGNGYYLISGIPEGNVYVYACPECNNQNFVGEWYNGGSGIKDCNGATGVAVEENQVTADINFNLQEGATVSGRVLDNSGNPVSGLWVHAHDQGCGGVWLGGSRTDSNGYYSIYGVAPGNVYVQACANCDNFMFTSEYWAGAGNPGSFNCNDAQSLNISAGENAANINFNLDPAGGISGYVKDESGQGISGIHVFVRSNACNGIQYSQANTDEQGHYLITGIPEGNAYVYVCPECNNLNFVGEWYNGNTGTPDCNGAVAVNVLKGNTTALNDTVLKPGLQLNFTINGDGVEGMHISVHDWHTGNFLFSRRVDSNPFTMSGLPEASQGKYRVYLISGETYYVGETYPVEVIPGQAIVFTPSKGGRIAGTITGNGHTLRQVCVNAEHATCTSQFAGGSSSYDNGVFGFAVQPGVYVVSANAACNSEYDFFREYWTGQGGISDCNFAEPVSVELEQDTIVNFDLEPGGVDIGDYDIDNDVDGSDLAGYLNRIFNEGTIVTFKDLSEGFGQ